MLRLTKRVARSLCICRASCSCQRQSDSGMTMTCAGMTTLTSPADYLLPTTVAEDYNGWRNKAADICVLELDSTGPSSSGIKKHDGNEGSIHPVNWVSRARLTYTSCLQMTWWYLTASLKCNKLVPSLWVSGDKKRGYGQFRTVSDVIKGMAQRTTPCSAIPSFGRSSA